MHGAISIAHQFVVEHRGRAATVATCLSLLLPNLVVYLLSPSGFPRGKPSLPSTQGTDECEGARVRGYLGGGEEHGWTVGSPRGSPLSPTILPYPVVSHAARAARLLHPGTGNSLAVGEGKIVHELSPVRIVLLGPGRERERGIVKSSSDNFAASWHLYKLRRHCLRITHSK